MRKFSGLPAKCIYWSTAAVQSIRPGGAMFSCLVMTLGVEIWKTARPFFAKCPIEVIAMPPGGSERGAV